MDNDTLNLYINGKVLSIDYIKELENNSSFMKRVFIKTRDKKYYNSCSLNLKSNYEFVLFLIRFFNDDLKFVLEVIDYYAYTNNQKDDKYTKIISIAYNKLREIDKPSDESLFPYYMKFSGRAADIFEKESYEIELKMKFQSNEIKEFTSLGFGFILQKYSDEEVRNMYARLMINTLFYAKKFEKYIHKKYKKKEDIETSSKNLILIEYIDRYDKFLSSYVSNRLFLIDDRVKYLDKIIYKYDEYIPSQLRAKADIFNSNLNKFLEENNIEYTYKVDLIKLEEINKKGLTKLFYSKENIEINFNKKENVLDFNLERVRKFIDRELNRLFDDKSLVLILNNSNSQKE